MTTTTQDVPYVPMPDLEPKSSKASLMMSVRAHFWSLYNSTDDDNKKKFRRHLSSVGNKDAATGNRLFDRHVAVEMIRRKATDARDRTLNDASDGEIYRCMVHILGQHPETKLKVRKQQYATLTSQAAE